MFIDDVNIEWIGKINREKRLFFWKEKKNFDKIFFNLFDIYLKYIFFIKESEVLDEIYWYDIIYFFLCFF